MDGFSTIAERIGRPGRMRSVHTPAAMRSARRRWGERFRERLRISSCCLTSTDSLIGVACPSAAPWRLNDENSRRKVQNVLGDSRSVS